MSGSHQFSNIHLGTELCQEAGGLRRFQKHPHKSKEVSQSKVMGARTPWGVGPQVSFSPGRSEDLSWDRNRLETLA